jgi:hypothetical protein
MIYLPNPDFPVRFAPFPAGDDFFAKGESAGPGGPLREVEPGRPDNGYIPRVPGF